MLAGGGRGGNGVGVRLRWIDPRTRFSVNRACRLYDCGLRGLDDTMFVSYG